MNEANVLMTTILVQIVVIIDQLGDGLMIFFCRFAFQQVLGDLFPSPQTHVVEEKVSFVAEVVQVDLIGD